MAQPSITNNMKIKDKEIDVRQSLRGLFCIAAGTGVGLLVYGIFLYFHIDIRGWNLGLIFAPLAAGYIETILANRIVGENIGAISAFILFIDTTFYSFILKNPTLGVNIITAGSIIVILQAAFPTLINYILLVVLGGILSYPLKGLKKVVKTIETAFENRSILFWDGPPASMENDKTPLFDEIGSNNKLNNLDFYFMTSTDMLDKKHEILGVYYSQVILKRDPHLIKIEPEEFELKTLNELKEGKDECLIKLSEKIKSNGGNGILNLEIQYFLVELGGNSFQINATGIGVYINE